MASKRSFTVGEEEDEDDDEDDEELLVGWFCGGCEANPPVATDPNPNPIFFSCTCA